MPLSETVSDLFVGNFTGLCEIFQNVYILLTLKGQKNCASLFICLKSPILIIYKLIYWGTTRLCFVPQDLFLFNVDWKSLTAITQSCIDQAVCVHTHCVYPERSFIPIVITLTMAASVPSLVDTGHLSPHRVLMESNTCAASWRYCSQSQISQFPGHVLKTVILV